jgi:hypothetical protein
MGRKPEGNRVYLQQSEVKHRGSSRRLRCRCPVTGGCNPHSPVLGSLPPKRSVTPGKSVCPPSPTQRDYRDLLICVVGGLSWSQCKNPGRGQFSTRHSLGLSFQAHSSICPPTLSCHLQSGDPEGCMWLIIHSNPKAPPHCRGRFCSPFISRI